MEMKVTIRGGDGGDLQVVFEANTTDDAAELVAALPAELMALMEKLRNGSPEPKRAPKKPPQRTRESKALPPSLFQVWEWLVQNDTPKGHPISAICDGLGLNRTTVAARMRKLMERGVVRKPRRGHYRAGEQK